MRNYVVQDVMTADGEKHGLSSEAEQKLRNSFKRCRPEVVEAIVQFQRERNPYCVLLIVHGVIERYLKLEPGEGLATRPDSARLGEDLGIDSLTMLEIVMSIEEALDFRIEDAEARQIRTLGDVRNYVDHRIHGRPVQLAVPGEHYDRSRLCLILPQQPPFLFLDRAELQDGVVRASYVFREDELFFPGHFRDQPVVPASIICEALGQAACLWVLERGFEPASAPQQVLFVGMNETRFLKRAQPGDEVQLEVTLVKCRAPLAVFDGLAKIGDQTLAKVEGLTLAFGEFDPTHFNAENTPGPTSS